jgi:hypothetical protein
MTDTPIPPCPRCGNVPLVTRSNGWYKIGCAPPCDMPCAKGYSFDDVLMQWGIDLFWERRGHRQVEYTKLDFLFGKRARKP